jgi:hypothetical protein
LNWKLFNLFGEVEMNKFEALAQFQSWPPEWQRLCAEYWIETGEDRPAVSATASNLSQVWCHADQVELAKKLLEPVATLAHESVSARLAQDKAAKVATAKPARNFMRYTRDELTEVDSHVSEGRGSSEVARIMDKKYPKQRTIDAWEKMANRIKKIGLQAMLERAIDVEFK